MTSQSAQIQELIGQIDGVLSKPSPRLPWVVSGDSDQQRRVLEQTRSYLLSIQEQVTAAENYGQAPFAGGGYGQPTSQFGSAESAQQVLQAVLQEMNYLRSNVMQNLRQDVDDLRSQKEQLSQEIRLLESQKQQYSLPQQQLNQQQIISDFLQSLMARLQDNLTGQVAQMLTNLQSQVQHEQLLIGSTPSPNPTPDVETSYAQPLLTPAQRLQQIQLIQAQSDQLLLKLDSTLRVIFDSLQSNLHTYEDSLGRGLDKMHNLGQQGEVMFAALVNRLAQLLGQEASTYLQSSIEATPWQATNRPLEGNAIGGEQTILQPPNANPQANVQTDLPSLDLTNLELGQPEMLPPPGDILFNDDLDDDLTFVQAGPPLAQFNPDDAGEATVLQVTPPSPQVAGSAVEIDSALELLNRFNVEPGEVEVAEPSAAVDESVVPEEAYSDVDELYESMFGLGENEPDLQELDDEQGSEFVVTNEFPDEFTDEFADDFTDEFSADLSNSEVNDGVSDEADLGLFGGLNDPAIYDPAVVTTLEGDADEDALFLEEAFVPEEPTSEVSADSLMEPSLAVDTIASLDDLIGGAEPVVPSDLVDALQVEDDATLDAAEDDFILASPDEVLFVPNEPDTSEAIDLRISSATLNQLTSDLTSFEQQGDEEFSSLETNFSVTEDADWTLADFAPEEPSLPANESLPADQPLPADEVDTLPSTAALVAEVLQDDRAAPPVQVEDTPPADDQTLDVIATVPDAFSDAIADSGELDLDELGLSEPDFSDELDLDEPDFSDLEAEPLDAETLTAEDESFTLDSTFTSSFTPDVAEIDPVLPDQPFLADDVGIEMAIDTAPEPAALNQLDDPGIEIILPDDIFSDAAEPDSTVNAEDLLSAIADELSAAQQADITINGDAAAESAAAPAEDLLSAIAEELETSPPAAIDQENLDRLFDLASEPSPVEGASGADVGAAGRVDASEVDAEGETLDSLFGDSADAESTIDPASLPALQINDDFLASLLADPDPATTLYPQESPSEGFTLDDFGEFLAAPPAETGTAPLLNDTAPPSPAIPLEESPTLDSFLDDVPAEPEVPPTPVSLGDSPALPVDEETAPFTLEGLSDNLFEEPPAAPVDTPPIAEVLPEVPSEDLNWTLEDAFAGLGDAPPPPTAGFTELDFFPEEGRESEKKNLRTDDIPLEILPLVPEAPLTDESSVEPVDLLDEGFDLELELDEDDLDDLETFSNLDDLSLEELLAPAAGQEPPVPPAPPEPIAKIWYLGIDVGTTGISAVLLNRLTCQLYPIYWSDEAVASAESEAINTFRLPAMVQLSTESSEASGDRSLYPQLSLSATVAMTTALPTNDEDSDDVNASPIAFLLRDFKPLLKAGIPHYSPETGSWEPVLQWSDHEQVALSAIYQSLRSLLTTLNASHVSPEAGSPVVGAIGLSAEELQAALRQLAGVVVGHPVNWTDTYSFNLREAVLGAKLVAQPNQIFLVEDVVAALMSGLRSSDGQELTLPGELAQKPHLLNTSWQGLTLVIDSGATATNLGLVRLPEQLSHLSYSDFRLRHLPYAGNALDQDILCQLIYRAAIDGSSSEQGTFPSSYSFSATGDAPLPLPDDRQSWQDAARSVPAIGRTIDPWLLLALETLALPQPGEPDGQKRGLLQQRLMSYPAGKTLLEMARYLKLTLQHQDRATLLIGDRQFVLSRIDLASRIFIPFIQRLNRELNALLKDSNVDAADISQVICTGGTASLGAIARWLGQKLPNATIIQDTYTGNRAPSPQINCLPTCSRVAYGLAALPLHVGVLNQPKHQSSDYFLLVELLRSFPDQPMTLGQVLDLLGQQGVDTQARYASILALLEGHLPPGLIPTERDAHLLSAESRQNPEYLTLLAAPLFQKQDQLYRPNYQQWNAFRRYLSTIMTATHQKLAAPLSVEAIAPD